jgi:hypothetical protein
LLCYLPDTVVFEEIGAVLKNAIRSDSQVLEGLGFINDLQEDVRRQVIEQAVHEARANDDPCTAAFMLLALIPVLDAEGRRAVINETLERTRAIDDRLFRAEALGKLLVWLEEPSCSEALAQIRLDADVTVREPWPLHLQAYHIGALLKLLPLLTEATKDGALRRALEVADKLVEAERWRVLEGLAPFLSGELFSRALRQVQEYDTESDGANLLGILLPHLSPEQLGEVLDVTRKLRPFNSVGVLAGVGRFLTQPDMLRKALQASIAITDQWCRGYALSKLVPYFTEDLVGEVLAATKELTEPEARVYTLAAVIPRLGGGREEALQEALDAARLIEEPQARVGALTTLAPRLHGDSANRAGREALEAAVSIEDENDRARALLEIVPHLSNPQLECLLDAARLTQSVKVRAELLRDLSVKEFPPHMSVKVKARGLLDALHSSAERARWELVSDLVLLLSAVRAVGGPVAERDLALALVETRRRWP